MAIAVMLATPEALVVAVGLDRVALAPVAGAMNVTVVPFTGFPAVSFTVAWSVIAKAVFNGADCCVPPVAVTLPGWPAVLVRENVAESAPSLTVTV